MKRRHFVALAVGVLGAPLVRAQQLGRHYRIGILGVTSPTPEVLKNSLQPFHLGMRELGWVDGTHYVTEIRWAEGRPERFPALAQELVLSKPDVLLAVQTGPIRALMQATRTIPIVMVAPSEPVASGLVASLARPGGNVTGMAFDIDDGTSLKQIDYLRQIVPNLASVAVFVNPAAAQSPQVATLLAAIGATGLRGSLEGARTPDEIEPAFVRMRDSGVQAALVLVDGMLFLNLSRLAEMGLRYRIALGSHVSSLVRAGGLIAYAPEIGENWRRSATYVHRILRGAKPAELPVELPSHFKLTINTKTARALGLKVPHSVLLAADGIIE